MFLKQPAELCFTVWMGFSERIHELWSGLTSLLSNELTPDISMAPAFTASSLIRGQHFFFQHKRSETFLIQHDSWPKQGILTFRQLGRSTVFSVESTGKRKNDVYTDKSIYLTLPEIAPRTEASLAMFIKAKELRLVGGVLQETWQAQGRLWYISPEAASYVFKASHKAAG